VLASGFDRPAKFDLAAHWARSTAELEGRRRRYSVVLALAPDAAQMITTRCPTTPWPDLKAAGPVPDGWVTMRADFDDEAFARFVVLGLGSRVRAIEPDEFREKLRDEVAMMAAEPHDQRGKERTDMA
jgi:predicted DNA-binding transcriptional regulator YafY